MLVVTAQLTVWLDDAYVGERPTQAVLAGLATVPLFAAHRLPFAVAAIVSAGAYGQYELGGGLPQAWFAVVLATYALGAHARRIAAAAGAVAVAAVVLATDVPRLRDGEPPENVLPAWVVLAAVLAFGSWMSHRRQHTRDLVGHVRQLEIDRSAAARTAVAQERGRLARELHDLVAHSMAVTVVQAQAAQRVLATDQDAAAQSLRAIEGLSRQGLEELRRLLGILGDDDEPALDPVPSLDRLGELVDGVRVSGLSVDLQVEGRRQSVPPGVDLSGYRIVQESLTNAMKHAGPRAAVQVCVRYDTDAVEIEVVDDGTGGEPHREGGHGLMGIRERVALFDGDLQVGNRPEGGFAVLARLPFGRPR